jgi:tetratricopeptide (TPR) repeat protein
MKKYLMIIFLVVQIQVFSQENPDSIFNAANRQYKEEKFDDAIEMYQKIQSRGYVSAALYYNIGNAYFKMRKYPKAILYYERSLLIEPGNINTKYNLSKARMYNIDKIDEIPEIIFKRWSYKIFNILTSNSWSIISVLTFLVSLFLLLVYFLSMRLSLKKISFYTAVILLLISMISFYCAYEVKSAITKNNAGIIMSPTVTVRSSPQSTGTNLFIIHEGTKVYIIGRLDNWYEIRLGDGKQGWLLASDMEAI